MYNIIYDAAAQRTRLQFTGKPTAAQHCIALAHGYTYNAACGDYRRGLNAIAMADAHALAADLDALEASSASAANARPQSASAERMRDLVRIIRAADVAYYRDDKPIMTDGQYDKLVDELSALEGAAAQPAPGSPIHTTAGANDPRLSPVKHVRPMLSVRKTKLPADVAQTFAGRAAVLSYKLDGLSLILRYERGQLVQAATRGEGGITGEDVTHTVRGLRGVPARVAACGTLIVRGEGVISHAAYKASKATSHPRNVAAGAVRSLDPQAAHRAGVEFVAYEIVRGPKLPAKRDQLALLSKLGFNAVVYRQLNAAHTEKAMLDALAGFDQHASDYPVDGVVVEFDDQAYAASLGETAHHRNAMLAYKWPDVEAETRFDHVETHVTRTGLITYVVHFAPVTLGGTRISCATVPGLDALEALRLGVGDMLSVYKANMVTPRIAGNLTSSGTYEVPRICPSCGQTLTLKHAANGARQMYCTNSKCSAIRAEKLATFCAGIGIKGLAPTTLEKLVKAGIVGTYSDLFDLQRRREKNVSAGIMRPGTFDTICARIQAARKDCTLAKLLAGFGIYGLRKADIANICDQFASWADLEHSLRRNAARGVSESAWKKLQNWYADSNERRMCCNL